LTGKKGLRGKGEISKTSFCIKYNYVFENKNIQFIDTPGFDGTEKNCDKYKSFLII
jgi:GTPase Era involved in 16S rRNA processing